LISREFPSFLFLDAGLGEIERAGVCKMCLYILLDRWVRLKEQAERENRDRGNEFHCHPLLQLSARLPVKEVRAIK
jgi:hypothetical protein